MDEVLKLVELLGRPDRILVVDDEAIVRMAFAQITDHYRCEVDFAPTVAEAMERLKKGKYDYVCLDMKLENRSGMEVLRFIDRMALDARVAVMSGSINLGDVMTEANNLGVVSFFNKPVDFDFPYIKRILSKLGVRLIPKDLTGM